MLSTKRKSTDIDLQRRVRARVDSDEEIEYASSGSSEEEGNETEEEQSEGSDDQSQSDSEDQEEEEDISQPLSASSISFGALAKAQTSLSQPTKKRKSKKSSQDDGWEDKERLERKAGHKDQRDFHRSSKHAPTELSSKKAVSRKREVVPVAKRVVRDPRFEVTSGNVDLGKVERNYAFLDAYREDEMKELKTAIKTTKDEEAKERLKRELLSMESRKKTKARKDREKEVLDRHRKEEKELVKKGKQPFYLKKSEQKKRLLVDEFGKLKGRQLDRVIERRRKKIEGKEKKNMPWKRRGAEV